jgi:Asp-tRNA(Asn)/Glu-tRNA(Gln) amidotransferase A subunit family amidase
LPMEGVLPMAHSLDTLGLFTNTPADMLLLWEALEEAVGQEENVALGVPELPPIVEPAMADAFRETIALLRTRGLAVEPIPIAPLLDKLAGEAQIVLFYEGARFHEQRFKEHGARLLHVADLVREGLQISDRRYREALAFISQSQEQLRASFQTTPVILTPAATGPAPHGLAYTGDARMNAPWTALGTPAISLPMPVSQRLPLGIQLTAAHGEDGRLLRTAVELARLFPSLK